MDLNMKLRLSKRALQEDFQGDFVKMMLEVAAKGNLISFAGGLPNPSSFPVEAVKEACIKVLSNNGAGALQYNSVDGYLPLYVPKFLLALKSSCASSSSDAIKSPVSL